jgi:hypothetical protein
MAYSSGNAYKPTECSSKHVETSIWHGTKHVYKPTEYGSKYAYKPTEQGSKQVHKPIGWMHTDL